MAGSLNKVILIGRLGQDPEVREVGSGKVANFSIATDESYVDKTGTKVEKTEWHRIVMWNRAAENAEKYLTKGSLIYVEGKLETRSWESESGERKYSTEIKSFSFQMLDNKNANYSQEETPIATETVAKEDKNVASDNSQVETEDDLPF